MSFSPIAPRSLVNADVKMIYINQEMTLKLSPRGYMANRYGLTTDLAQLILSVSSHLTAFKLLINKQDFIESLLELSFYLKVTENFIKK